MLAERPSLLMLKAITAIYLNRKIGNANGKVDHVIKEMLTMIKLPTDTMGEGSEGEITRSLRATLEYLTTLPEEIALARADIIERIRVNCAFANEMVESLERLLSCDESNETDIQERIRSNLSEINFQLRMMKLSDLFREGNRKMNFQSDGVNVRDYLTTFTNKLRELSNVSEKETIPGLAGELSTENMDSVASHFEKAKELSSEEGMLKLGLQGMNRLFAGGLRRGGAYNFGALSHHYKSGMLMDLCRWIPMCNTPFMHDPKKKPIVIRLSFENKIEQDLPNLYKSIWETEHQQKYDLKTLDGVAASRYIVEKLTSNGYHFDIKCMDPNVVDCWDIIDILNGYEARGYEVHALILDYPELITKKTSRLAGLRKDEHIAYTYEVLRNHCFPRGITLGMAHQLSMDALKESRQGTANFAEKMASGSYYHLCNSLSQKLDAECILHIHKVGEDSYLTMARGKDRFGADTPISHRKCAYQFQEFGGLGDDLNGESRAIYKWSEITGDNAGDYSSGSSGGNSAPSNDW